ncbi:unnamed protein product, partial [marine sediment metagenome]
TVIKKMAPILGSARYFPLAEYKNELRDKYDFFVIGGPVDNEKIDQSILDFVSANTSWLSGKRVALFATCPSEVNGREQLEPLMKVLGNSVVSAEVVHGDADHLDLPELVEYALRVKALFDKGYVPMPAEQLKTYIEGFLKSCKYCTISGLSCWAIANAFAMLCLMAFAAVYGFQHAGMGSFIKP